MPDFHLGDSVQIVSPKARTERMAVFTITEFKDFDGELCATGDGHAWWPVEMLDYALSAGQLAVAEMYERAVHDFITAMRTHAEAEKLAALSLPGWYMKRIRDAASL